MQGVSVSKEDEARLLGIIRSVDKKLDYSLSLSEGSDAARPNFTLHLTRQAWAGTMNLVIADLQAAKTDLVCRNKIRQRIKRLRDHMWDSGFIKDVLGTEAANMLRQSGQSEDSFRRQFVRRPTKR